MRVWISLAVLSVALSANAAPVKVALPGLSAVQLDQKLADFLNEQLAQELSNQGVEVVTSKEIAALLGMERQKQLLGCTSESSSCIAELADALGSDAVLIGDVAKVGARYHVTLKAMAAGTGNRLTDFSGSSDKEEDLVALLGKAAAKMAPELSAKTNKPLGEKHASGVSASASNGGNVLPLALLVGGGAVLAAGGAFEFMAFQNYNRLRNGWVDHLDQADQLRDDGKLFNTLGVVGMGVGAAALATGIYLKVSSGNEASAAITPAPNGLMVVGTLPDFVGGN